MSINFILDINECASSNITCLENFQCRNTIGSYDCVCSNGFFLNTDNVTCCKLLNNHYNNADCSI